MAEHQGNKDAEKERVSSVTTGYGMLQDQPPNHKGFKEQRFMSYFLYMPIKGHSGEEPACQCRRHSPWVHKIPWRRAWQPTHYSCLEESGRLKSQTKLKQLSTHAHQGLFGELCSFLLFRDLGRPSGYHLECGQVLARGREIIVLKLRLNTPAKLINKPSTQNSLAITGHNLPILRVWRCHSTCV